MTPSIHIVIPAKDEATRIGRVIRAVRAAGFDEIVVVDDGSRDATARVAAAEGATVLTHLINLGAGAATQTGIEYALERGADIIVTLDGDNQHYAEDIERLLAELQQQELEVVLGSRFLERQSDIPTERVWYNRIANLLTALITGLHVSDSQSGMKAFRAGFARRLDFTFNGYEFCTEFIHLMRHHRAPYAEVPIRVRYTEETMRKGQSLVNGMRMVFRFLRRFM